MKNIVGLLVMAIVSIAPPTFAEGTLSAPAPVSNATMKRIFEADQADRLGPNIDWNIIGPRDAERRLETHRLLDAGQLHTGEDFIGAAFVFQHGSGDDFLLAHTLAIIATKKGDKAGPWIAAATLDRYLQTIGRKQIYGTQSTTRGFGWNKEPYDKLLISDALRREMNVPDLTTQDLELKQKRDSDPQPAPPAPQTKQKASNGITCDTGPINRIFVRATWQIRSCSDGALIAVSDSGPPAILLITVKGAIVTVKPQGNTEDAEVAVATAAFGAMTPVQITAIIEQTKTIAP